MAKKSGTPAVHVMPHGEKWQVKVEGNGRASVVTDTKAEAEKAGRERAKKDGAELVVHRRDGVIKEKDSYGHDPRKSKG